MGGGSVGLYGGRTGGRVRVLQGWYTYVLVFVRMVMGYEKRQGGRRGVEFEDVLMFS